MTNIVEIFTSIQGEGQWAGKPSIFVRFVGCNLKCCFGKSICDTFYTSYYKDKATYTIDDAIKYIKDNFHINHIVITGGEPLLYVNDMCELIKAIDGEYRVITIETNGTLKPLPLTDLKSTILYSISPKLSTSVASINQTVEVPGLGAYTFTEEEVNRINRIRINYDVLKQFTLQPHYQFKFVYTGEESIVEIEQIINDLDIPRDRVYLMPEGDVESVLMENRKNCVEVCLTHGLSYTDRLHIIIWNNKRCV